MSESLEEFQKRIANPQPCNWCGASGKEPLGGGKPCRVCKGHKRTVIEVRGTGTAFVTVPFIELVKQSSKEHSDACLAKNGIAPPLDHPLGDAMHHLDVEFTPEDLEVAELAWYLGCLSWEDEGSSLEAWARVARALRIHGLKIVNR